MHSTNIYKQYEIAMGKIKGGGSGEKKTIQDAKQNLLLFFEHKLYLTSSDNNAKNIIILPMICKPV